MTYLDHVSGMPTDPRVISFAERFLSEGSGNPFTLHSVGLEGKRGLEDARAKVADFINAESPGTIVFTSGATESNNLAVRGTGLRNRRKGTHVLMSAIEHISVVNPMKELGKQGFDVGVVPVDSSGILDLNVLREMITPETTLVSVNYANDEIGTIEPVQEISQIVHEKGALLHMNATAAAGRVPVDVEKDGIDLLTLSSNDLGGPRGAGALYMRKGVRIQPVVVGGGQERGLRPGTENLFAIAGMGEAARLASADMVSEMKRLSAIRDAYIKGILEIEEAYLTGHPERRLPGHASFRFSRIEGESILLNLDTLYDIQVATGSACTSQSLEASSTLLAIGLRHEEAHGSMVLSLGRQNTSEEVPAVIEGVRKTVERLRRLSPL